MLIAAQPTWGVDVGAAAQIRQALLDLRDAGVAVLVVSEELDELFEICDRLAVIAQGRLSDAKPRADTNAEEIGLLMSGSFIAGGAHSERHFSPAGALGRLDARSCLEPRPEPSRARRRCVSPLRRRRGDAASIGFVLFSRWARTRGRRSTCSSSSPSTRVYGVGELLLKARPLMLCAIGLAVGYRANVWNIGAEGQLTMGAIAGGGLALAFHDSDVAAAAAAARCSSPARWAAWRGRRSPRSCAPASTPTRSWSR